VTTVDKLRKGVILLIILCLTTSGCACKSVDVDEKTQKKSRNQLELAFLVADLIPKKLYSKDLSYDYSILCTDMNTGYSVPVNSLQKDIVPPSLISKIKAYNKSKDNCVGDQTGFLKFLNSISDHVNRYDSKLTVLIQFPWKSIDKEMSREMTNEINKINKKREKINKILLFGSSGDVKRNVKIFEPLTDKISTAGMDIEQVGQHLDNISKTPGILERNNSVIVFFAPIELYSFK
jgi:hypothetical protein